MDIRNVKTLSDLTVYFSEELGWDIDTDDFIDIEDITYDFSAEDIGLKEEAFAKIDSLQQLPALVDGQKWGIFFVEFESNRFEVSALRKILSGLVPKKRNSEEHAVWDQRDLVFLCTWGENNNRTIGIAHFEDKEKGLPQIKMISCAPAMEDFTQINVFKDRLSKLAWPDDTSDLNAWRDSWSDAFVSGYRQAIQDSATLTVKLAAEAQNIRDRILDIMDVESSNGYVHLLYDKFRSTLIEDMTEKQFADMYAQTVVYGLFSARCMDDTQEEFSAAEAVECIPSTNPFLKSLMQECLGAQNTSKLSFDELEIENVVDLLRNTKTDSIIQDFNRQTGGGKEDPVIHFYEEFLTEYDKEQKVQRGVFYTPQPIVNFMVRAVDDIIRTEFKLDEGLASEETKIIDVMRQSKKRNQDGGYNMVKDKAVVPAIQILDPATGTGTFLRQTILQIYYNYKSSHRSFNATELREAWNDYVPNHLLPRLNGFEIMMAPYAVAHMKLAMVLKETGYSFNNNHRFQLYLANTLEEPGNSDLQITMFEDPLATESVEANEVKKNSGINVLLGNPPYSGESANKGEWIMKMMEDYKKEPGGVKKLNERNPKWLNDDYVKFIRYGAALIESAGNGILAYICPHGFLDNPTFRGMRWHLTKSFNTIHIIDLHGNVNKHETCPDGSKDENVFDIQQGVCIILACRKDNQGAAIVKHGQLYGLRDVKYDFLNKTRLKDIEFTTVDYSEPQYCFVPRDNEGEEEYTCFFSLKDLFPSNSMGVVTAKDKVLIGFTEEELERQVSSHYGITPQKEIIFPIDYRPFDKRYVYYDTKLIERSRESVMKNFEYGENIGLVFRRQSPETMPTSYFFVCNSMMADGYIRSDNKGGETVAPLFIYETTFSNSNRSYNLSKVIVNEIEQRIGKKIVDKNDGEYDTNLFFTGKDLIQYIYARLYSPIYRKQFESFIKVDYPKVPYPENETSFRQYQELGKELMDVHLQTSNVFDDIRVDFKGEGDSVVETKKFKDGKVFINKTQFFEPVTERQWNLYYGGYQPLQKWLKDRKGKTLDNQDIAIYKRLIVSLKETEIIQQKIEDYEMSKTQ